MEGRVKKWGNSLGIRIPQSVAEDLGLAENSAIDLRVEAGQLVIRPKPKTYRLDDLLQKVTPENIHEETDWGPGDTRAVLNT